MNVPTEELRVQLEEMLDSPHRDIIADIIIGSLDKTNAGLENLVKALYGYKFVPKYQVGEEIFVQSQHLASWRIDPVIMKEKGLLVNEGVRCKITDIDQYEASPYQVKYSWINDRGESGEDSYHVGEHNIFREEFPEDLDPRKYNRACKVDFSRTKIPF